MTPRVDRGELDSHVNGLFFLGEVLFSGESVETLKDGTLATLTTYVDGVEEGPHRMWHDNGALEFSCELHDGNPVGLAQAWSEDGHLEEEQFFDGHGALEWSRRWNAEGDLVEDTSPTARTA